MPRFLSSFNFRQLLCMWLLSSLATSFVLVPSPPNKLHGSPTAIIPSPRSAATSLTAVTEEDVLAAVEKAENLWAQALEARQKADEAANKAEAARAAATASKSKSSEDSDSSVSKASEDSSEPTIINEQQHDTSHLNPKFISLAGLADNMEADQFVQEAEKYSEEADEIEFKANQVLAETEKLLEQHLKDFPNSPLADDEN